MSTLKQWKLDSPIGDLYLVASESALQGVFWKRRPIPFEKTKILSQAARELGEYFSGRRTEFEIPLDARGTAFQEKVWAQLRKIPYGKTCSYRELASRIRNAGAARAVGTANGRNPLSIVVPCHRVIAADGSLGGYAGGLSIKARLLELERAGR